LGKKFADVGLEAMLQSPKQIQDRLCPTYTSTILTYECQVVLSYSDINSHSKEFDMYVIFHLHQQNLVYLYRAVRSCTETIGPQRL